MFKKFTIIFVLLFATNHLFAQGLAYYPFNSVLSISTNPSSRVWLDCRIQTNTYFSSLSTEISPMININNRSKARFYVGGGAKLNFLNYITATDSAKVQPLEGFFMNFGVRSAPFKKEPRVQIVFEISPYVNRQGDLGLMRTLFGIGYFFGKEKGR